jgi:hypothetical protein
MAAECTSPLGNKLEICPSLKQLEDFYRNQLRFFESKFIRKLKDGNLFRVTSESLQQKVISLEVSKLVFLKSLASRFSDNEVLERSPLYICEVQTLRRLCNIFGKDNLVRRFNSGDFTIIIPFYAVVENFVYELPQGTSIEISMGQLVLSIEHKGDYMKCLIPYGGSNPGEDDILPDNFALRTIEVDGDSKDLVRLDRSLNFNARRCIFFIKRPLQIISQEVSLPVTNLKYVRRVSLRYRKEYITVQQGELQITFFNAAFNKCGIMTHDIAIPVEELLS